MAHHPDELEADMQEVYGIDLSRAAILGYSALHIAALAYQLPPQSRVWVAEDDDNRWSLSDVLAAAQLNQLRAFATDGSKKPELVGPSWMRDGHKKKIRGMAMTKQELLEALARPRTLALEGGSHG